MKYLKNSFLRILFLTILIQSIFIFSCASKRSLFRAKPKNSISIEAFKKMVKKNNFFHPNHNKSGFGFSNNFELIMDGKVVIDHASGLMWQQSGSKEISRREINDYLTHLNEANYNGYSDWRMPTVEEGFSLIERNKNKSDQYIDPIFNKEQITIWTADKGDNGMTFLLSFYAAECFHLAYGTSHIRAVNTMKPMKNK